MLRGSEMPGSRPPEDRSNAAGQQECNMHMDMHLPKPIKRTGKSDPEDWKQMQGSLRKEGGGTEKMCVSATSCQASTLSKQSKPKLSP